MPFHYYDGPKLNYEEVAQLFREGKYIADLELGEIYSGKTNKPLNRQGQGRNKEYECVQLYSAPKMRNVGVAKLIWMLGNEMEVPDGFKVHHRDKNTTHNSFVNLFALSEADHKKLHENEDLVDNSNYHDPDDDIPF